MSFPGVIDCTLLAYYIPCTTGYHLDQGVTDLESFQQINFDMVGSTNVM